MDAMTEGFIVGPSPTITAETPKISTTVQASQTPAYISEDMSEGSAAGKISDMSTTSISLHETRTLNNSHAQTSAFTESPVVEASGLGETSDESQIAFTLDTTTTNATNAPTSNSTKSYMFQGSAVESTIPIALDTTTATHAPTSDFTEHYMLKGRGSGYTSPSLFSHTTTTSVPSEDQSSNTSNNNVLSQTTDPAVSTSDVTASLDSGSGSELVPKSTTMTSGSSVETSTVSSELSKRNRIILHRVNNQENIKGKYCVFNKKHLYVKLLWCIWRGLQFYFYVQLVQQAPQTQTQTTNTEPTHKGHVTPGESDKNHTSAPLIHE